MTQSHALALALVVTVHAVVLAAWDRHLTRLQTEALAARAAPAKTAPTLSMTVVASRSVQPR